MKLHYFGTIYVLQAVGILLYNQGNSSVPLMKQSVHFTELLMLASEDVTLQLLKTKCIPVVLRLAL